MKSVKFKSGGKTYALRFTTNAMADFEDEIGEPLLQYLAPGGVKRSREIIRVGLKHEHPDLTSQEVGVIIDDAGGLEEINPLVLKALGAAADDGEAKGSGND